MPLVQRIRQPYLGDWALPGGQLRSGRSLEQSAYRALESTTHLRPDYLEQLYTFGDPERSHGGLPMVSIVYWALVSSLTESDYERSDPHVAWLPDYAVQRLRARVSSPQIVTRLIGERFTLAQLHDVYEAIIGQHVDLANFRRKMLTSGQLEDTGEKVRQGRQRPASLYRYRDQFVSEQMTATTFEPWQGDSFAQMPDFDTEYRGEYDPDEALTALTTTARELT